MTYGAAALPEVVAVSGRGSVARAADAASAAGCGGFVEAGCFADDWGCKTDASCCESDSIDERKVVQS